MARKIEANNGKVSVERVVSDGYEVIEAPLPAVVTAGSEIGDLRFATMGEIVAAQKKPTTVWNAQELGVAPSRMKRVNLLSLSTPPRREAKCQVIEGETLEEAGAKLALKLREAKII